MGFRFIGSASASVRVGKTKVTSVLVGSALTPGASGHLTLYNATAATAGTEIMFIHLGTAPSTVSWSDPNGLDVDNLWATANSCNATIVWD